MSSQPNFKTDNLENSFSSFGAEDLVEDNDNNNDNANMTMDAERERLWNSMSVIDSCPALRPVEMLPLRPGSQTAAHRSSAPSKANPCKLRGHLRPDDWVGKKTTKRSWKVKSISDASAMIDETNNSMLGEGTFSKEQDDASIEPPSSVRTFHVDMLPGRGTGHYGSCKSENEVKNLEKELPVPDVVHPIIIKDATEKQHQAAAAALDGNSMHSVLTEDSRSRISSARDMWNSLTSLDYQHSDAHQHVATGKTNADETSPGCIDDSSSIGVSSAIDMWNSVGSFDRNSLPSPPFKKKSPAISRLRKSAEPGPIKKLPMNTPVVIEVAPEDNAASSSKSKNEQDTKQANPNDLKMDKAMEIIGITKESGDNTHLPRHSNRSSATTMESLPELEMSLTSIDFSLDESAASTDPHETETDKMWKSMGSIERSLRPSEMLPLRPSAKKRNAVGGTTRKNASGSSIQHNIRALNRPDDWLGGVGGNFRPKPARRSWTVKRIIESPEAEETAATGAGD